MTQNSQSDLNELVDFIEKSNENLDGPEDKFGFNKTLWTPEESSRANGKKLKWLLVTKISTIRNLFEVGHQVDLSALGLDVES